MSQLCIHHHQGLGDHMDCNGLVRYILEKGSYDKVHVFSKSNYYDMIEYMYRDNENIVVAKIDKNGNEIEQAIEYYKNSSCTEFVRIGFENYPTNNKENKNCWEFFYEQVGVPCEIRAEYFYIERDPKEEARLINKLNPTGAHFAFIHDDPARGYEIDREHILDKELLVVENDITENIFTFIGLLETAEELHCMESSMKSLMDLYSGTEKMYFHNFRNHPLGTKSNKNWKVINYSKHARCDY